MNSYEVQDNITPMLNKLSKIGVGFANQALNKTGALVQNKMAMKSRLLGSHRMGQSITGSGRTLVSSDKNYSSKAFYSRESHTTGSRLNSMGDLIRFRLYPLKSIMLVGWINTAGFNSMRYVGGVGSKYKYVKGTKTKEIAERMSKGGRVDLSDEQKRLFRRSGWSKAADRGYVQRRSHSFMNFASYLSLANSVAQKEFDNAVTEFKKAS